MCIVLCWGSTRRLWYIPVSDGDAGVGPFFLYGDVLMLIGGRTFVTKSTSTACWIEVCIDRRLSAALNHQYHINGNLHLRMLYA